VTPSDWTRFRLDEIVDIVRGISFPSGVKSSAPFPGSIGCLRTTNVQRDVEWADLWFVPESFVKKDAQIVRRDDVLISNANSLELVGKVALVLDPPLRATLGAFITLLRARPGKDPRFIYHQLASPRVRRSIRAIASTTTNISNVSTGKLAQIVLAVPSLDEQREIVAEIEKQFTRLDAGVAALRRVQANLKRYRAAVLKAACEGRVVPTEASIARRSGRAYESGEQLLARILIERRQNWRGRSKCEEAAIPETRTLPPLPAGWAYASVEAVGRVQLGRQRSPKDHSGKFMRPYLRVANVYEDHFDLTDVKEMNFTPEEFKVFQLLPNDILLNEGQSLEWVGRPALYRGEVPGACFQNTLVRFRPNAGLNPRFALAVFRAFMHDGRFQKIAKWTTNIAHLGASRFAQMAFPLPPLAEQERIALEVERHLSVADAIEAVMSANRRRAASLRQSILRNAFSGGRVS
jgi:type I restriction enzyme S subunit